MNYNQLQFWLLFACLLIPYWWISRRAQNRLLLVASYVFYGFWDYRFLFLILVSTAIDFFGGLGVGGVRPSRRTLVQVGVLVLVASLALTSNIEYSAVWSAMSGDGTWRAAFANASPAIPIAVLALEVCYAFAFRFLFTLPDTRRRKWFLTISMVANLGILGFFKYCDFFVDSFNHLLFALHVESEPFSLLGVILPAGISFYTFQAMSYTIDIYRKEIEPTKHFGDFALFVCFFPHLVAGPIMRAHTLLPQVLGQRTISRTRVAEGGVLILIGLFKKIALSDNMAPIANAVFYRLAHGDTAHLTSLDVLVGIYAFAIQIYGDFSGYSAIARGISKWLGFELVVNFRQPYLAVSPSDFWKRWHISLSSWLRDYLYISLGGNRRGTGIEYRNLLITMILGGLWHGASWTFVVWGIYHGVLLCAFRLARVRDPSPRDGLVHWGFRVFVMFHLTCLGWLFFRADSFVAIGRALSILGHMTASTLALVPLAMIAFYWIAIFCLELFTRGEDALERLLKSPVLVQGCIYAYIFIMIFVFAANRAYEFIYFQF